MPLRAIRRGVGRTAERLLCMWAMTQRMRDTLVDGEDKEFAGAESLSRLFERLAIGRAGRQLQRHANVEN
jgi:hypothetical protein